MLSVLFIKEIPDVFRVWILWFKHLGCCSTFAEKLVFFYAFGSSLATFRVFGSEYPILCYIALHKILCRWGGGGGGGWVGWLYVLMGRNDIQLMVSIGEIWNFIVVYCLVTVSGVARPGYWVSCGHERCPNVIVHISQLRNIPNSE